MLSIVGPILIVFDRHFIYALHEMMMTAFLTSLGRAFERDCSQMVAVCWACIIFLTNPSFAGPCLTKIWVQEMLARASWHALLAIAFVKAPQHQVMDYIDSLSQPQVFLSFFGNHQKATTAVSICKHALPVLIPQVATPWCASRIKASP